MVARFALEIIFSCWNISPSRSLPPPRSNERVMNKPAMKKEIVSALAEAA